MRNQVRLVFYGAAGIAALAAWPMFRYIEHVKDTTKRTTQRATRRQLVRHLRANPRGLWVLDNTVIRDSQVDGPLTVLGDHAMVANNYFRGVER